MVIGDLLRLHLGVILYGLIKPQQFSWSATFKCIGFTTFLGIPWLLFAQQLPVFRLLYAAASVEMLVPIKLVGFVLGVGLLEETCKCLPVYFFIRGNQQLNHPLSCAFYGAMSGLGFAIAEGAHYSLRYAEGLVGGELGLGSYMLINTIRFISLPLFHAIWAGIVGYFVGLSTIYTQKSNSIIIMGIAISAVLHGLYNTYAGSLTALLVLLVSILLLGVYLNQSSQLFCNAEVGGSSG